MLLLLMINDIIKKVNSDKSVLSAIEKIRDFTLSCGNLRDIKTANSKDGFNSKIDDSTPTNPKISDSVNGADGDGVLTIYGVHGSLASFIILSVTLALQDCVYCVTPDIKSARLLQNDLMTLGLRKVYLLNNINSLVAASMGEGINIFITVAEDLNKPLPEPRDILAQCITLKAGGEIPNNIEELLIKNGYYKSNIVMAAGEFVIRGEVIDIALDGGAYRLTLDYSNIYSIKAFDIESQQTLGGLYSAVIIPPNETKDGGEVEDGEDEPKSKSATIGDYICDKLVFYIHSQRVLSYKEAATARFPISVHISDFNAPNGAVIVNSSEGSVYSDINLLRKDISQKRAWMAAIFTNGKTSAQRVSNLIKNIDVIPSPISSGFELPDSRVKVIAEGEIFRGKQITQKGFLRIDDVGENSAIESTGENSDSSTNQSGEEARFLRRKFSEDNQKSILDVFTELKAGDFVVHVQYGIGKFIGIEHVKTHSSERDYIKLEYAAKDYVLVPTEQTNLIARFIGGGDRPPALDKIGGADWVERRAKVRREVADIAAKLIALYAKRLKVRGFACAADNEWDTIFEANFPYEDTVDQTTATREIKRDMEAPYPMDRLLCGDVGFGKTEVAMRAAFKAVGNGRQVAFLCPTTILAQQHYETFKKRFSGFPVAIKSLSRFTQSDEVKKTLTQAADGTLDILIGTHRILQKDVIFLRLGLLVIDEEQRFGVSDKEKIKRLHTNVDCLTLSATPIPRTLHMSLLKIRDMSLLTTPPQNRKPIETVVTPYTAETVVNAVNRELSRGGQIFYLHNRVETLSATKATLQGLLPNVKIAVAHGQMSSTMIEGVIHAFRAGEFDMLLATTIIENGIDIPSCNTIIIDRADMYGVSQLYQLRGRVGRAANKAYAYLLYRGDCPLSELATKRLQAISDFSALGSGFKIAMRDMEIRGAGNLLGRDQSGMVYTVGFDMYCKLLNQAVASLIGGDEDTDTLLQLNYSGYISDAYIKDAATKMELYKSIASITSEEQYQNTVKKLQDRFGPPPDSVKNLLEVARLKIIASRLKITSIKEGPNAIQVAFGDKSKVSIDRLLALLKTGDVALDAADHNNITIKKGCSIARLAETLNKLVK